jgi:chromosome segregation ATPase
VALVIAVVIIGESLRQEIRAHGTQLSSLINALKSTQETLTGQLGKVADRSDQIEQALQALILRADAALSAQGTEFEAYRERQKEQTARRVREFLKLGNKIGAVAMCCPLERILQQNAFAFVDAIAREMGIPENATDSADANTGARFYSAE